MDSRARALPKLESKVVQVARGLALLPERLLRLRLMVQVLLPRLRLTQRGDAPRSRQPKVRLLVGRRHESVTVERAIRLNRVQRWGRTPLRPATPEAAQAPHQCLRPGAPESS